MSILTALPDIAPTTRSFVMDKWPQGQAKMRNGRVVKWAQVSAPAGASLELVWENITYAQAETILMVWDANYGIYGAVNLTTMTLAGLDPSLGALIRQPFAGVTWRSEGPPEVEAIKAKRCTVRLQLRTRRDLGAAGGVVVPDNTDAPGAVFVVVPVLSTGGVVLPGVALTAGTPVLTTGVSTNAFLGSALVAGTPILTTGNTDITAPGVDFVVPAISVNWGTGF